MQNNLKWMSSLDHKHMLLPYPLLTLLRFGWRATLLGSQTFLKMNLLEITTMMVVSKYQLLLLCANSFIYDPAMFRDLTKLFSSHPVYRTLCAPGEHSWVYMLCYVTQPRESHIHSPLVLYLTDHVHTAQHQFSVFPNTFIRQPKSFREAEEWKILNFFHPETWIILFLSTYFPTVMEIFISNF